MTDPAATTTSTGGVDGEDNGAGGAVGRAANPFRDRVAVIVAALALLALALMIYALWNKADDQNNETAWARWTFLLAGVEAVAFAGAGFLFGREVNRAAVQTAQNQAERANRNAVQQAGRAGNAEGAGRALRNAIEAKARTGARGGGPDELGARDEEPSPDLRELSELARATFPD